MFSGTSLTRCSITMKPLPRSKSYDYLFLDHIPFPFIDSSRSRLSVLEEKVEKKEAAIALLESDKKTLSEELRALQAEYAVLKVSAENSAVLVAFLNAFRLTMFEF